MPSFRARAACTLALAGAALAGLPGAAQAGRVEILACGVDGVQHDNRSWGLEAALPPGILNDNACPIAGANIDLHVEAGARTPDGAEAAYTFRAPPGTRIVDFRLDRRLIFDNPTEDGTHRYYALYVLGPRVFAGAGNYDDATRDRLNATGAWYGYPANNADTGRGVVRLAGFADLRDYRGDATSLSLRVGCFRRGTPCSVARGGAIRHVLFGTGITVEDPVVPSELVVEASGLLAGGERSGSDPIRIARATDNMGIRRAEILDVTDPAAPRVVGAEDYDTRTSGTRTDRGGSCAYRLTQPCPNLVGETLAATSLPAGRRQVAVRVTDPGGLTRQSLPYTVDVAVPADRGAPNGVNATEGGRLTATFSGGATRLTADFGDRKTITGRLVNEGGQPVAGVELRILTRDADRDAFTDRGSVRTDGSGAFSYSAAAYVNRLIQFGWKARTNDARFAATAFTDLRVRAAASLRANKRRVSLRRSVRLRGTLSGRRQAGVDVVLEGRQGSRGRYRTFDRVKTRSGGTLSAKVRFVRRASRGRSFRIRARILPTGRFPYLSGTTKSVKIRVR